MFSDNTLYPSVSDWNIGYKIGTFSNAFIQHPRLDKNEADEKAFRGVIAAVKSLLPQAEVPNLVAEACICTRAAWAAWEYSRTGWTKHWWLHLRISTTRPFLEYLERVALHPRVQQNLAAHIEVGERFSLQTAECSTLTEMNVEFLHLRHAASTRDGRRRARNSRIERSR